MSETTTQPKPTPNRRRQGRNNGRSAAQKAYASEGDMAPRTPEKHNTASQAAHHERLTSGKQRNKPKSAKSKNAVSTSPEPDHLVQQSTPIQPTSAKGAMAFAGATFHASPAPSALPMPSFLSKISSASSVSKSQQGVYQQPSPPNTDADAATPHRTSAAAPTNESPLDFMFRAHRQEKERERSDSTSMASHHPSSPSNSPFGAGRASQASVSAHSRPAVKRHVSSGGIDSYEMDGHYGQPTGPSFSTPYHERIRAAHSSQPYTSPGQQPLQDRQQQQQQHIQGPTSEDPTEALKKFLFGGNQQSTSAMQGHEPLTQKAPSPAAVRSYDAGFDHSQGNKIQAMENDLRRILNIEGASAAPNTERRLFTQ